MKSLKQIIAENTLLEDEDKFDKVMDAHISHIHKTYGDHPSNNIGSGGSDNSVTSKVFTKDGKKKYVTTHFHPTTFKVGEHITEDLDQSDEGLSEERAGEDLDKHLSTHYGK